MRDEKTAHVRLELEAEVDAMGRSIRPSQVQSWLADQLGLVLHLRSLCRESLRLTQC